MFIELHISNGTTAFAGMALIFIGLIAIDGRLLSQGARLVKGTPKAARSVLDGH